MQDATLYLTQNDNRDNKRTAMWISFFFHMLLLFLFIIPCFSLLDKQPPEPRQGIMVAFGNPESETKTNPRKSEVSESTKTTAKPVSKPVSKPTPKKSTPKKVEPQKSVAKKVVSQTTSDEADVVASKKKAEAESKAKAEMKKREEAKLKAEQEEAERQRKMAEEKARQEAEARKKAEAKSKAKSKFSSLFGNGDEDASDSKGSENGKPNASALDGLSTGSGKVGDGLGDRGTVYIPTIKDDTQKKGRVVVKICVNKDGKVISAKYTQKGSTTTDAHLINVAEKNAKKYKFNKSNIQEQCGNIIIDFKLK